MKIQLLSDLHLECERPGAEPGKEFYSFDFPVAAEYLALLGDVGCTFQEEMFTWLRTQLLRFEKVLFVSGNHGERSHDTQRVLTSLSYRTVSFDSRTSLNKLLEFELTIS